MTKDIYKRGIIILDFGSQYAYLLVRRIRELGVYCELFAWDTPEVQIRKFHPRGIILSGGPSSVTEQNSPRISNYIFEIGVPILGVCYGMHIIAIQLGGQVEVSSDREFGYAQVELLNDSYLTHGIYDHISNTGNSFLDVWMSHSDKVTAIPKDFITVAKTENCPFAIIANEEKKIYGVQFHLEVTHTPQGKCILERFIFNICQCDQLWITTKIIENMILNIREQVCDDFVLLGLSGGLDSLVTAILLHRAIGKQLICIFIDNGLLRFNEAKHIIDMLSECYHLNIIHESAEDRFLSALTGITDPEIKRKIIGKVFLEIFEEKVVNQSQIKWLAQGTIYPDIIESAASDTGKAQIIKSHHNVAGLPKKMKMGLLEPLKALFKDEVRNIGLELGLSHDILYRHPFPGPGLGVRILGEVKREYCNLLKRADSIFIEELRKWNLYKKISQAFAVFLPICSVGVMGDKRKYDWVIALRAIETIDFMTAHWVDLPHALLERVSNRIINEIDGISRVVYDISSKPPATIEWE